MEKEVQANFVSLQAHGKKSASGLRAKRSLRISDLDSEEKI